jgi:hypothetical protein
MGMCLVLMDESKEYFRFQISDFKFQISNFRFLIFNFKLLVIKHLRYISKISDQSRGLF